MIGMLSPLLGLAKLVPAWVWVIAAVLGWGGIQHHRAKAAGAEMLHQQQVSAEAHAAAATAALAETGRRLAAQQEIAHAADQAASRARADASAAADATVRLRQRIAALQASAGPADPAAAGPGAANRLGDALSACGDRYRDVAAAADRAITAGLACERAYTSLTDRKD